MKKAFLTQLSIVITILLITLWSLTHYILMANQGVIVLNKRFITPTNTFADIRAWSSKDFDWHPEIKQAMTSQGCRDILIELKIREMEAGIKKTGQEIYDKAEKTADSTQRKFDEWLKSPKSEPNEEDQSQ
jgi:hypothetical protein